MIAAFGRLSDETRAIVRTTTAVTRLSGSLASNALAEEAHADVNVRIAVGSTVEEHAAARASRDPRPARRGARGRRQRAVTGLAGQRTRNGTSVRESIAATYPGVIVSPYVMLGASDSRHFTRISDAVYRFTPFELSAEDRATLHARDERIRVATWLRGIASTATLLRSR